MMRCSDGLAVGQEGFTAARVVPYELMRFESQLFECTITCLPFMSVGI